MADVHSKEVRSYNMSRIRSKDTTPEMIIRKFLFANRFRYRLHVKALPGSPDLVLAKYKTAILIHGCFWHGHKHCKYFKLPKTNAEWWATKIEGNKIRDHANHQHLQKVGFTVIVVWECQLKKPFVDKTLLALRSQICGDF